MTSNVFSTPTALATIAQGRVDTNISLQALLQNFYSEAPPNGSLVTLEGVQGLKEGMIWVQQGNAVVSDRMFIYNPAVASHPLYPGFTRNGIGITSVNTYSDASSALSNSVLQAGELVRVANQNRVYLVNNLGNQLINLGSDGFIETANNANYLGGYSSTSYVRTDVDSTVSANITVATGKSIVLGSANLSGNSTSFSITTNAGSVTFSNTTAQPFMVVNGSIKSNTFSETLSTITSNAAVIDCSVGNIYYINLFANTTISFSNVPSNCAYSATVLLAANSTSLYTVTWPASVKWSYGRAPVRPTLSEVDMFNLHTINGGTTWYGSVVGENFA